MLMMICLVASSLLSLWQSCLSEVYFCNVVIFPGAQYLAVFLKWCPHFSSMVFKFTPFL